MRMTDIAKACGVSAATVSYVLNNRPNQRVSKETREKILHYANLTGYVSSPAARALSTGRHNAVGVYAPGSWTSPGRAARTLLLYRALAAALEGYGFSMIQLTDACMRQRSVHVDAILAVDPTVEEFYAVGWLNYCPLLCIDGAVDDPMIFYQVYDDFAAIARRVRGETFAERLFLLYDAFRNERILRRVTGAFDVVCGSGEEPLASRVLCEPDTTAFVAFGRDNAQTLRRLGKTPVAVVYEGEDAPEPCVILPLAKKAETIVRLIQSILRRESGEEHDIRVF